MRAAVELAGYTPSESDELRKAISKKKKEDIDKHRAKFVKGAVEKGMDQSTADAIYMDWEEFARYGFNKISCCRLWCHRGANCIPKSKLSRRIYGRALLSASAGQTEKVAFYVADARTMGVPVLPPDVNASNWDFGIEDIESDSARPPSPPPGTQPPARPPRMTEGARKKYPISALAWARSRTSARARWKPSWKSASPTANLPTSTISPAALTCAPLASVRWNV